MRQRTISAALLAALGREPEPEQAAPATEASETIEVSSHAEQAPEQVSQQEPAQAEQPQAQERVESELVRYLKDELKAVKAELHASREEVLKLTAQNSQMNEGIPELEGITREFCTHLAIALGGQPIGLDRLSGAALASQYHQLRKDYEARFPVGGRSKANTEQQTPPVTVPADPRFRSAVRATAFPTR